MGSRKTARVIAETELGSTADEAAEVDHALGALAARGRAYELELARWLLRAEALAIGSASRRWRSTWTAAWG